MRQINPVEITDNFIKLISSDWMLITAGDEAKYNMMTASWGGVGELWGKHVATAYVRPERYTDGFIARTHRFTLSFFNADMKKTLGVMGKESGRDYDKMNYEGLTAKTLPSGQVSFEEARLVLDCEVLYADELRAGNFLDKESLAKWYNEKPGGSLHNVYIAEIKAAWIKDDV